LLKMLFEISTNLLIVLKYDFIFRENNLQIKFYQIMEIDLTRSSKFSNKVRKRTNPKPCLQILNTYSNKYGVYEIYAV
jgi:hypothetical protein